MFRLSARFAFLAASALGLQPSVAAAADDLQIARGEYLVTIGGCNDCHTPGYFFGKPDSSRFLGGSDVGFEIPGEGVFVGSNITPDKETGIGELDQGADRDCNSDRATARRSRPGANHAVACIREAHRRRRDIDCSIPSKPETGKPSGTWSFQVRGEGFNLYVPGLAAGRNRSRRAKLGGNGCRVKVTVELRASGSNRSSR